MCRWSIVLTCCCCPGQLDCVSDCTAARLVVGRRRNITMQALHVQSIRMDKLALRNLPAVEDMHKFMEEGMPCFTYARIHGGFAGKHPCALLPSSYMMYHVLPATLIKGYRRLLSLLCGVAVLYVTKLMYVNYTGFLGEVIWPKPL